MVASSLEISQAFETASDASQNDTRTFTPLLGSHLAHNLDQFEKLQVSENDIKDKGKSDNFAKAVAMLQVLQLVLFSYCVPFSGAPICAAGNTDPADCYLWCWHLDRVLVQT